MAARTKAYKVTRRYVNTKRHTLAYQIAGKKVSRQQATKMAREGQLSGVVAVGNHIQSLPLVKPKLYDLPATIVR